MRVFLTPLGDGNLWFDNLATADGSPVAYDPLARAFRWRKLLDDGIHTTIEDLAKSKGLAKTYVSGILRLTLLAPEIVEAIMDGRQAESVTLPALMNGFTVEWAEQDTLRHDRV